MKTAIIDFGTNTFNLLIADTKDPKNIQYLHNSKEAVKLGKGGITKNLITEEAITRAMHALDNHYKIIRQEKVEKIYGFATSAIREAKNGKKFLLQIKEKYDLYVNIIPGDREAELIYKGVRQSCSINSQKVLILDIGGGSNEFIIADNTTIYWKESYKLGMARLLELFKPEDPISEETIEKLLQHFNEILPGLFSAVNKHQPTILIGASGSFDTFYSILNHKNPEKYPSSKTIDKEILIKDFNIIYDLIIGSSIAERKNIPGIEAVRVEMIVLAAIFVKFILEKCNLNKVLFSDYALKEGIIAELLNI